ncbi:BPSL0067 family protein [Candidatus Gracilibacteria bacterium]|nr:BPSL0067 family protein [Candidatus Gracilibacteria bacterium]
MKFAKYFFLFSVFFTQFSLAADAIAPNHRVQIWIGPCAILDSEYTIGETTAMGTIKTLKSNTVVLNFLTEMTHRVMCGDFGKLDLLRDPGATLHSKLWFGSEHQSVSDRYTYDSNRTSRQCVAFVRSMTGTKKSTFWRPGKSLISYVQWDGSNYSLNPFSPILEPGTMIAHFRGKDRYPTGTPPWGHVAIFLSWSYGPDGYIDGINVVDQNITESVKIDNTIIDNADGLIQKHKLPWICTAGKACGKGKYFTTFFSSGYHVVDVQ